MLTQTQSISNYNFFSSMKFFCCSREKSELIAEYLYMNFNALQNTKVLILPMFMYWQFICMLNHYCYYSETLSTFLMSVYSMCEFVLVWPSDFHTAWRIASGPQKTLVYTNFVHLLTFQDKQLLCILYPWLSLYSSSWRSFLL